MTPIKTPTHSSGLPITNAIPLPDDSPAVRKITVGCISGLRVISRLIVTAALRILGNR